MSIAPAASLAHKAPSPLYFFPAGSVLGAVRSKLNII